MDYQDIIQQLTQGSIQTRLTVRQRKIWPRFAYHFTDIENAVSILRTGQIYSRSAAIQAGVMLNDNASEDVIQGTEEEVENFVRLYFRPRTPTQFHNEGFQTKSKLSSLAAECPMPIFFVFKLPELLRREDVYFSAQTLAKHEKPKLEQGVVAFSKLPFEDIYDEGVLPSDGAVKRRIISHRQAEIVTRDSLDLTLLHRIVTRSSAEKQTLLDLLHQQQIYQYDELITDAEAGLFYKDRNYINRVSLTQSDIIIESSTREPFPPDWGEVDAAETLYALNPDDKDRYLSVTIRLKLPDNKVFSWPSHTDKSVLFKNRLRLKFARLLDDYHVEVYINGHIAYSGKYKNSGELPF